MNGEMHRFSLIRFLSGHLDGFNKAVILIGSVSLLMVFPIVALPIIGQLLVDNALSGINPDWGLPAVIASGCCWLVLCVLWYMRGRAWRYRLSMSVSSASEMFWHTIRLPLFFFSDKYAADITNRVHYGSDMADRLIDKILFGFQYLIFVVIYMVIMVRYNAFLSLFAIAHIILSLYVVRKVHARQVMVDKRRCAETDCLFGITSAGVENIEAIKGSSSESVFFQTWVESFTKSQNASTSTTQTNIRFETIPQILNAILTVVVLGIGAWYVMQGLFTAGMLMTYQTLIASLTEEIGHTVNVTKYMASVNANAQRMNEVLEAPCDVDEVLTPPAPNKSSKLRGRVELRNVSFGYDRSRPPLIKDFSMVLEPGKSTAFVGPSGCGKSTIAKLVSGLYKPWEGEILYDGIPLEEVDRNVFSNSVSIVDQNIVMFEGSVADNVKLWDDSVEDFAMIMACHDAQIHDEMSVRDEGYASLMESGGKNFSGGQRQRIELASAFVKDPSIMIMDEGTSALDAVTEERVMTSIANMGCSLIMIAHRLSTIRDCDEIIVLDGGKVVERGKHSDLVESKGFYYQLVKNG